MGHVKNVRCSKIRIGYDVNMAEILSLTEDAKIRIKEILSETCLLYTSDAADE